MVLSLGEKNMEFLYRTDVKLCFCFLMRRSRLRLYFLWVYSLNSWTYGVARQSSNEFGFALAPCRFTYLRVGWRLLLGSDWWFEVDGLRFAWFAHFAWFAWGVKWNLLCVWNNDKTIYNIYNIVILYILYIVLYFLLLHFYIFCKIFLLKIFFVWKKSCNCLFLK